MTFLSVLSVLDDQSKEGYVYLSMVMSQGGEIHAEKERKTTVTALVPEPAVIRLSWVYQKIYRLGYF